VTSFVLELSDISKSFGGLRPLRIERLTVSAGERVALLGVDQAMAEVFVNLATGAALPDRGTVAVSGRPTSDITDSADWLAVADRFGIVSDRAVLLEGMTVLQNLALPFSLDIEPPTAEVAARAERLAEEVGLPRGDLNTPIANLGGAARLSVRIGRALALDPEVLLLEHPSAFVERAQVVDLASRIRAVAQRRGTAVVALTADQLFADALGGRSLRLDPGTGRLSERRANRWLGRLLG
jgi:ABC-type sulfate/molybdate transport systems ATPase subunit